MAQVPTIDPLVEGKQAFGRRRWSEAVHLLSQADQRSPLDPHDYQTLVIARALISPDQEGGEIWAEAHQVLLERGDVAGAARAAFWAGQTLLRMGEPARGSGWIERGRRVLDEVGIDCVERGYLLIPLVIAANRAGDTDTALGLIAEVADTARRFGDADLQVFIRHAEGRALLRRGDIAAGMAIVDETMLTVTTGGISPLMTGAIFCSLIEATHSLYDLGRAREWTAAMEQWCLVQPDLNVYRGECQIYRAHVLKVGGDWEHAVEQTNSACVAFLGPPLHPAAGLAFYEQGELHRLAGRFAEAEAAFARASELGHPAQPGVSLLRLGQGRLDAAAAAIRRALAETPDPLARAGVLPAVAEIMLAIGDVEAAGAAGAELAGIASALGSEYLAGLAAAAEGAALLLAGEAPAALPGLRQAARTWQQLNATYLAAQTRLWIGRACRQLGDEDGAKLEIEAARQAFLRLGAGPDAERAATLLARTGGARPKGLTARELELLALLATGKTNREIAEELVISEKTVARHVSNIFAKLGVSTRAAATAFAVRNDLA
jgi:DNA-binding CsgD family transcriptional regulator